MYGSREISRPLADSGAARRIGKAGGRTPIMNGREKSDSPIVPKKSSNKADNHAAETAEGRGLAKENTVAPGTHHTQRWDSVSPKLVRVREVAQRDKDAQFTALLHHVTLDLLRAVFYAMKRKAAPGADGVTWKDYEKNVESNLEDLLERVHRNAYRATPSRRVLIPKADGRQRLLGIASLEDKILQGAVLVVLNSIYESDFLGFSYGFRPGRGCHQALDALATGIRRKKVNWVLDADIRGFFDALDHEVLMEFLERRIGDKRILRLVRKWLKVGVLEDGLVTAAEGGTPQGATISPLLANIYLHYALDAWAHEWRQTHASGDVILVRYADDLVAGFQHRHEAERFQRDLRAQLATVSLELHPDKTRLIEFGRFAAENRNRRGDGKPETFDFLGFTHICGRTKGGGFMLHRRTIAKRARAKLQEIKQSLRKRWHAPLDEVGQWLHRVMAGYYRYYAVPTNLDPLRSFRDAVTRLWWQAIARRSQRGRITWKRMHRLAVLWLPQPQLMHPLPEQRFDARIRGRSPVR